MAISGDWYAFSTAAVVAILGGAAAGAVFLRLDLVALLRAAARLLDPLLWAAFYIIAVPLALLLRGIVWLIRQIGHPSASPLPQILTPPRWVTDLPHQSPAALPPPAAIALRWGAAAFLVALILLWLWRSVFRYECSARDPLAEETRDSVWAWPDVRAVLARWHRRRAVARASVPQCGTGAAARVRRAYAELLGIASARGYARPMHLTPAEFAATLRAGWPESVDLVAQLTDAYSRVRYGLLVPRDAELDEVRDALVRLRAAAESATRGEGSA